MCWRCSADRKLESLAGRRQQPAAGCAVGYRGAESGGGCSRGGEGDGVAEGFELADQAAGLALGVDLVVVPAGTEVGEAGGAVGKQVEDDDQDGTGDRGERFALAASSGDPPVAFAE